MDNTALNVSYVYYQLLARTVSKLLARTVSKVENTQILDALQGLANKVMYDRDTEQNGGSRLLTMSTVKEAKKDVEAYNRYLPILVPYISTESPVLCDTTYEVASVALETILSFHKDLLFTVKSWPLTIYSVLPVIAAIEIQLTTSYL
ncbi:hypothetical protein Tco_0691727 [Tanacetum coccineum]